MSAKPAEEELLREVDLDALRAATRPLAFWRARRRMSIARLAQVCALTEGEIAARKRGACKAEPVVYERPARILDVDVEDLVPEAA